MLRILAALGGVIAFTACATHAPQTTSDPPYKGTEPQKLADRVAAQSRNAAKPLVLIGAGDIANCVHSKQAARSEATGQLLNSYPDALVFTAGDNAYNKATAKDFATCYHPRWGINARDRTLPSPGNHDYGLGRDDASPYFAYFGDNAGPDRRGYYSVDFGTWHIISLNSDIVVRLNEQQNNPGQEKQDRLATAVASQERWLQDDLQRANQSGAKCVLAIWHHPRYNDHGRVHKSCCVSMSKTWSLLMRHKADVVISAHEHRFDVFDPRDEQGNPSSSGIRQFVVGNGGAGNEVKATVGGDVEIDDHPSEAYGVLKMTLREASYSWEFLPIPEHRQVLERLQKGSGTDVCHAKP